MTFRICGSTTTKAEADEIRFIAKVAVVNLRVNELIGEVKP